MAVNQPMLPPMGARAARTGPSRRALVLAAVLLTIANLAILTFSMATAPPTAAEPERPDSVDITDTTPRAGEEVEVGPARVTVHEVTRAEGLRLPDPRLYGAPAGELWTLRLTFANRGDEKLTALPMQVLVIDSEGRRHGVNHMFGALEDDALSAFVELAPGGTAEGIVVLDLAAGVEPVAVWFPPGAARSDSSAPRDQDDVLVALS